MIADDIVVDTQVAVADDSLPDLLSQLGKPMAANIDAPHGYLRHHKHFDSVYFFCPMTLLCL